MTSITLEAAQVDYNPGELAVENSSEVTSITLEAAGELAVEVHNVCMVHTVNAT